MSAKTKYSDELLGRLKIVRDFLPRPQDLVFRDEGVKVTIALSKRARRTITRRAQPRTQHGRAPGRCFD